MHKRKKVTTQRMLSFTKRLATLALQLLHNGSLGALNIIKLTMQVRVKLFRFSLNVIIETLYYVLPLFSV